MKVFFIFLVWSCSEYELVLFIKDSVTPLCKVATFVITRLNQLSDWSLVVWVPRYIKAVLLPSGQNNPQCCCTKPISDLNRPRFGQNFPLHVPLSKLCAKTLQINVWSLSPDKETDCLVSLLIIHLNYLCEAVLINIK